MTRSVLKDTFSLFSSFLHCIFALILFLSAVVAVYAQDPRERQYMYEILDPRHEPKPLVEGFAKERITEHLNRGLYAAPSQGLP